MACPRCGEVCHCFPEVYPPNSRPLCPRFEADSDNSQPSSARLIDPEPYEATEEEFSASLENSGASSPRFVPDRLAPAVFDDALARLSSPPENPGNRSTRPRSSGEPGPIPAGQTESARSERTRAVGNTETATASAAGEKGRLPSGEPGRSSDGDPDDWKEQVAARVSRYRARRTPRPAKYPSLALNFEPPISPCDRASSDLRSSLAIEPQPQPADNPSQQPGPPRSEENARPRGLPPARVIEFPRFFAPTENSPDQLAEPVCQNPRILDAPEVELPAPALGGIVLETSAEKEGLEGRPGFEVPLDSASVGRRLLAAGIDLIFVAAAGFAFGYIFLMLAHVPRPVSQLLASAAAIALTLWAAFQYLLLTYAGTTPGIRIARLRLSHFDGSPVPRARRRWRALASILSGVSLGLGFAWCLLDEDALCWHDRITRTHLAREE